MSHILVAAAPDALYVMLAVLGFCGLFFLFEKPLRWLYLRWSWGRFRRRTGIDPRWYIENPFK